MRMRWASSRLRFPADDYRTGPAFRWAPACDSGGHRRASGRRQTFRADCQHAVAIVADDVTRIQSAPSHMTSTLTQTTPCLSGHRVRSRWTTAGSGGRQDRRRGAPPPSRRPRHARHRRPPTCAIAARTACRRLLYHQIVTMSPERRRPVRQCAGLHQQRMRRLITAAARRPSWSTRNHGADRPTAKAAPPRHASHERGARHRSSSTLTLASAGRHRLG